jgi:hypothetical protein
MTSESSIERVRKDFLSCIVSARRLMNESNSYHHLILVSTGNVASLFSKDLHDTLAGILDSTTIDMISMKWQGVNTSASVPAGMSNKLVPYLGFKFPMFFPSTVQLSVDNGNRPFLFPLDGENPGVFAVSIRTQTPWDTIFNWTGFASNGEKTASFSMKPNLFLNSMDSGLVKLWAKDENHLTDKEEIYPAGTFGIVTKAAFLQATVTNINQNIAKSVPFLNDDEIHALRTQIASCRKLPSKQDVKIDIQQGVLSISSSFAAVKLEIFDLQGRLIASINPTQWAIGKNSYLIPLKKFLNLKGLKMMLVKISGIAQSKIFKLNLEGLR